MYIGSVKIGNIGLNAKDQTVACNRIDRDDVERILDLIRRLFHAVGVGPAVIDIGSCYSAGDGAVDICASIYCRPVSIGRGDRPCDIQGVKAGNVGVNEVGIIEIIQIAVNLKGIVCWLFLIHAIPDDDRCRTGIFTAV